MKSYFKVITCVFLSAAIAFFLFNTLSDTKAEGSPVWITIDASELETVQKEALKIGLDLGFEVSALQKGIAVVRADDEKMELLSSHMHTNFQKCSGFVAHTSKEKALESIDKIFSVDLNQSFVDYTIDNQTQTNILLNDAEEVNVKNMIVNLSSYPNRRYNQPSGLNSANFIKNTWTIYAQANPDITVEFVNHPSNVSPQPSVVLTIPGSTFPNEEIILGGHQDSINRSGQTLNAPGADDDASGIASLTEAIRVLVAKGFRPERTVKFMAYAAEEVGLRGSNAIAADYRSRNVNVIGALQLDMTNFNGSQSADIVMITDFTNAPQNQFVMDLAAEYMPNLNVSTSVCNYGCSDHASWTSNNYPASFPFEASFGEHNSAIHTANDQIGLSQNNANHAVKFTKLALAYVSELAKGTTEQAVPNRARSDFDGDGRTDVSVFRPDTGVWYMNRSTDGFLALNWGLATDKVVAADFNGDNKTDIAIFRADDDPSQPDFYILDSADFTFSGLSWGNSGDLPVVADYDGDEKADISIYRPSDKTWYVLNSADFSVFTHTFGETDDKPLVGDFDGDGKADLTVLRNGIDWYISRSTQNYATPTKLNFGVSGDIPTPADFNGDGTDNVAIYRPSNGSWYFLTPANTISIAQFGATGDVPVTGDYDGDGITDFAVWRPSNGAWYILQSTNSAIYIEQFGLSTDIPIPFTIQP